jgi:hypothetical protein
LAEEGQGQPPGDAVIFKGPQQYQAGGDKRKELLANAIYLGEGGLPRLVQAGEIPPILARGPLPVSLEVLASKKAMSIEHDDDNAHEGASGDGAGADRFLIFDPDPIKAALGVF